MGNFSLVYVLCAIPIASKTTKKKKNVEWLRDDEVKEIEYMERKWTGEELWVNK